MQIRRLGHAPISKTFPLKAQAWEFAAQTERDVISGRYAPHKFTVDNALTRYAREVSPKKRGSRWEKLRIEAFRRHRIASKPMQTLTEDDVAKWRDDRLLGRSGKAVQGSTVRREMNLWQSVFETARKEWRWVNRNPVDDVKKPPKGRDRRRGVLASEIDALKPFCTSPKKREVFEAFRLGVETAMRAGEMLSLSRHQIDLGTSVAHLDKTKNGDERDVPLSPTAVSIVKALLKDGREKLFLLSNQSRDVLFRGARDAAGLAGLNFHDSRSEAISRLSKKMDVLELARVVGQRDIKSLMHYYRADAAAIARRLAADEQTPKPRRQSRRGRKRAPKA